MEAKRKMISDPDQELEAAVERTRIKAMAMYESQNHFEKAREMLGLTVEDGYALHRLSRIVTEPLKGFSTITKNKNVR